MCCVYQRGIDKDNVLCVSARCWQRQCAVCISEVLTRTMCCVYQRGVDKGQCAVCISEVLTRDNVLCVSARC